MDRVLSLQSRGCWFDTRLVHAYVIKANRPVRQKYFYSQNGDMHVMRQSACLVFNPITVDNYMYAAFFNCTPVGRASDSMMAPT